MTSIYQKRQVIDENFVKKYRLKKTLGSEMESVFYNGEFHFDSLQTEILRQKDCSHVLEVKL